MSQRLTRRNVIKTSLVGLGGTLIARPALAQAVLQPKPDAIVVNASGGLMNSIFRRSYFAEFERRHGIRVIDTSPTDFGKLRAMVETGNPEWTVTELGAQDGLRAKKMNLLESLDMSIIDLKDFPKDTIDSHVYCSTAYSTAIGYRNDVFQGDNRPKSMADFWDTKKFPGPRSLRNHPVDNLEFALLADGVPRDKLYPLDLDRAFKKLDELKPNIAVWWTTGSQPAQLLVDREVVLASSWNGRLFDLALKGAPVGTMWEDGVLHNGSFGIPRGTKQAYWGQHFIQVMTDPKLQAVYASEIAYPGLNKHSIEYIDEKLRPLMPTAPANYDKQVWQNSAWWMDNAQAVEQRWRRWMLQRG